MNTVRNTSLLQDVFIGCAVQKSPELFRSLHALGFKLWKVRKVSWNGEELLFLWKDDTTTPKTELFNAMTKATRM
jgi:hypothetical protein